MMWQMAWESEFPCLSAAVRIIVKIALIKKLGISGLEIPLPKQRLKKFWKPSYVSGLSLLGGEPFEPENQSGLLPLVKKVKETYPEKNIWCYTGYLFDEDICGKMMDQVPETKELLSYIDVLIDGPFIEERKNLKIRFRGSDNQRIIDVKKTMEAGEIVLWEQE